jgi:hypothetical protein
MNTNVKTALFSVLFTAVSFIAGVETINGQTIINVEKSASTDIRYTGANPDFINFEVNVRQTGNQRLTLRILDENGVELYRELIGKGEFNKLVKVTRNDYSRLLFVIDAPNGQYRKSFNIKSEVVERVSVEEAL